MGTAGRTYRFGGWTFDPRTGELEAEDRTTRLAPQPALVLSLLLERPGELVTRDFLQARVWPDTVVEFDKSLNFCIREVRAALGDRAASPTFIETLPRRGYRFKAPVRVVDHGDGGTAAGRAAPRLPGRTGLVALLATGVLLAAGLVLVDPPDEARAPSPLAREAAEMAGYLLTRGEGGDVARSVDFFREAVALSPGYARAYAGLGAAYLQLGRVEEGERALRRSLELGPDQWAPHLTLALQALYTAYDRPSAGLHFDAALERAPDEVVVRHTYAWYRAALGDLDAALEHMRAALELDPVSPRVNGDVGRLFYLAGRQEQAVAHCRRTQSLLPGELRHRDCVVHALVEKGARKEATTEAAAILREHAGAGTGESTDPVEPDGDVLTDYWRWAGTTIAERAARGEDSHVHAAAAWARAGEPDRAFAQLEAAWAVRCPVLLQIGLDPAFDPLRPDPRFRELVRRTGPAATRASG